MKNWIKPCLRTPFAIIAMLVVGWISPLSAQFTVFSDDFSTNTSAAWTANGALGASAWGVNSTADFGARRNTGTQYLEANNDISAAANASGYTLISTPPSSFSAPYTTILNQNDGVVSWTFNMRQIRADPSGFDVANYGVALILAAQSATTNATGNGYAVVLGNSGTTDPLRLVRYSAGITGNSSITTIISSIGGLADLGTEYLSVRVTYNPCNADEWQLFARNDGGSFQDPESGSLTLQGTASDGTYTGTTLDMMAAYWQGSTTANQDAYWDNVKVKVTPVAFTPGVIVPICQGATQAFLPYTNLQGGADEFNIDWDAAAEAQGFVDVANEGLTASPQALAVPGTAAIGTYNGTITLISSSTLCESDPYNIQVSIQILPVDAGDYGPACDNDPNIILNGSPSGGTWSGVGVTGNQFDPSVGTQTLTYTVTGACSGTDQTTITVDPSPAQPNAGTYGPVCANDPNITLMGTPPGGTWSGPGVVMGNQFDPNAGTQTIFYTITSGNCSESDPTTITVNPCLMAPEMRFVLLDDNAEQNGSCISQSDCDEDIVCFGLQYTPNISGDMTSYTTGFTMPCLNGLDPVISQASCVITTNSLVQNQCPAFNLVQWSFSGASPGTAEVVQGEPIIIHQVCFRIPTTGSIALSLFPPTAPDALSTSINDTFELPSYVPFSFDSSLYCGILPVRYLYFDATKFADYVAQLDWVTAEEINNHYFEVQRSNDKGKTFTTIGKVFATDNPSAVNPYQFFDQDARPGVNYYRLKQFDRDGRFEYSPVRTVNFSSSTFSMKAFPNPTADILNVYVSRAAESGLIELVDIAGRLVRSVEFIDGDSSHELDVDGLTPGIYTLMVTSGEERLLDKIVIMQ